MQDRVGEFLDHMELADLVRDGAEDQGDRLRVKCRTIGGDARQHQAAGIQLLLEIAQEAGDVLGRGGVIQHPIGQAAEVAVVHEAQHAEGAIVQFIDGDVAAEAGQGVVEIFLLDLPLAFFPPPPRPSSGS
jgi:hypothetical protein